jgi:hypothetical protein
VARLGLACGILALAGTRTAVADIAFQYDSITNTILSAEFSVDFAAMNAHRTVGEFETNFVQLVDCVWSDGHAADYSVSDDLFGTASWPDAPALDMGELETGIISAPIDASFYPALAGGAVGLRAVFTDTVDAMFAMDFISLTIETDAGTVEMQYGWPMGNENNGFGVGLSDGDDLPAPLPDSIPIGATGTGFDETISSKSILAIPEPATLSLLLIGGVMAVRRQPQQPRVP